MTDHCWEIGVNITFDPPGNVIQVTWHGKVVLQSADYDMAVKIAR